jgi:hypothetical protein
MTRPPRYQPRLVALAFAALAVLAYGSAQACETLMLMTNSNGKFFEMSDGSKWIVTDPGIAAPQIWTTGEDIEACEDTGALLNVDMDDEVKAKRVTKRP